MSYANENLGDWKSFLSKVRKLVHKTAPRELSPTRMLEKYASDTKKKNAAKLAKVKTASVEKNAAADALVESKITNLQVQALPVFTMNDADPRVSSPKTPLAAGKSFDWTSTGLLAALALGGVLIYLRKRR